jgi:hypothetical protein
LYIVYCKVLYYNKREVGIFLIIRIEKGDIMYESKPWLALYPKEIPATLEYSSEPVQQYLVNSAKRFPEKVANT